MPSSSSAHLVIRVAPHEAGQRLDKALAGHIPDFSRSQLQDLIRAGHVTLNGHAVLDPGRKVRAGDEAALAPPAPQPAEPLPEAIPLDVLHEDESLIVVNKPAGLVVHPAPGARSGTLVNALIAHCGESLSGIGGVMRPGIVHRLDKDTSGVMVVAKTDAAHRALAAQFADHGRSGALERRYMALVWGEPRPASGRIETLIGRPLSDRKRMAVLRRGGRRAATRYAVAETFDCGGGAGAARSISLVACTLETGRTHQVRVHMAHIGHPLLGDALYGSGFASKILVLPEPLQSEIIALSRQALHAETLAFEHPKSKKIMRFCAQPPSDMLRIIEKLRSCHK